MSKKKLELFRKSGQPVDLSDRSRYEEEWKQIYDKVAERAKLDMLKSARMLSFCERQLVKRHNIKVEVDLPTSDKAWSKLIAAYEDVPIMVARTQDGKRVVGIIMDDGLG